MRYHGLVVERPDIWSVFLGDFVQHPRKNIGCEKYRAKIIKYCSIEPKKSLNNIFDNLMNESPEMNDPGNTSSADV